MTIAIERYAGEFRGITFGRKNTFFEKIELVLNSMKD